MSTILDRIKAYKLEEIAARKAERPLVAVEDAARAAPAPRGFARALSTAAATGYGLIAEIKKASPSKGPHPRGFRRARPRPRLRDRRRHLPLRPDRRPLVPGRRRLPASGPRGGETALPAQGFPLRHLSGGRSAGARRRLHPHHHGERDRQSGAGARGGGQPLGHGCAGRGPFPRGTGPRRTSEVAADRHQQPQSRHVRGLARRDARSGAPRARGSADRLRERAPHARGSGRSRPLRRALLP